MTCPGVLLTGGNSRRMGVDKATLVVNDETLATRAARVLTAVCEPAVEVGDGITGLRSVRESPPGRGPLAAFLAGVDALGARGPVMLLACDLPFVDDALLIRLVTDDREGSIVPVIDTRPQYACARWSAAAIAAGRDALAAGRRALGSLAIDIEPFSEPGLDHVLADVDTPEDLRRLGLSYDLGS